ncbi:MAG: type IX secretion system protein PorQ [Bacteroidales bacterium]
MLKKYIPLIFTLLLSTQTLFAQVSGEGTYQFLSLPTSARATALGGKLATLDESDLSTIFQNPSLLDSSMHNNLTLSYVKYYAGIQYGTFAYARVYKNIGTFAIGGQRIGYGSFTRADETGTTLGTFTASEMAISLSYSRTIDTCFSVGISIKPVYSHLEKYTSWGIAADIAGNYRSKNGLFSAGITFKNIGAMIKTYTPDTHEPLPFEIIAGISKKLAHAPFRFVVTLQQLQNMDLYYEPETFTEESAFDETESSSPSLSKRIGREFMSHVIVGAEFIPVRNFYLRFGYNYQRRNELKIKENVSTVGFSWGIGIKISKFHINYSRATLHLAGATNHFAITTDLDNFFKKH